MIATDAILAVNNFGDTRDGGVAGPLGGVIVLILLVVTVLLIRNMNSRLRKLPKSFPPDAADGAGRTTPADPPKDDPERPRSA